MVQPSIISEADDRPASTEECETNASEIASKYVLDPVRMSKEHENVGGLDPPEISTQPSLAPESVKEQPVVGRNSMLTQLASELPKPLAFDSIPQDSIPQTMVELPTRSHIGGHEVQQQKPMEQSMHQARRRYRYFTSFALLLVLGGIGLTLFLLWPNISLTISTPGLDPNIQNVIVSGNPLTATNKSPVVAQLNLQANISIVCNNDVDIAVTSITVFGKIISLDNMTTLPTANVNGKLGGVTLTAKSTTTVSMPLTLVISTNSPAQSIRSDPAWLLLSQLCGRNQGLVTIEYTATVDPTALGWTGYRISFDGELQFLCPDIGNIGSATLFSD